MKKVLSFVLVLAMILGSVSLAFAQSFPDTEGTDYDEAVRLLTELGVISGYDDGTFKPDNNVTRAEFAAMMVRALGFQVAGTSAVTAFSDVPATYWASTYIKYASELGIIYGYNDGTFRPKNNITNDEAIAMLVRTLGYQAKYMTGTYPTSHINVALGLDILDGIPTGSAAATRGDVAQLIFNALLCRTITYDGEGKINPGATLLTRLGGALYNGGYPFVVTGTEPAVKGVNLNQYLGAYVVAYASKYDDTKIIAISSVLSEFVTDGAEIAAGEEDGCNLPSHCAKRNPWYAIQVIEQDKRDAFFTYRVASLPVLILNDGEFCCTNSLHYVAFNDDIADEERRWIQISLLSVLSLIDVEYYSRVYGSNVLKVEPSSLKKVRVYCPNRPLPKNVYDEIEALLGQGERQQVIITASACVFKAMRLSKNLVRTLCNAYNQLRKQRMGNTGVINFDALYQDLDE